MVLTNKEHFYRKLLRLRSHGITRDPKELQGPSHGPWYYQQIDLGFNYRMTDIQAALGCSQMQRIDDFVERRHTLVTRYHSALDGLSLKLPWQHPDAYSAHHLFVVRLKLKEIKKTHRQVFEELRSLGVNVNIHYIPVHTQPFYMAQGFKYGDFPEAEKYYQEAISIPLYYGLSERQQDIVIDAMRRSIT